MLHVYNINYGYNKNCFYSMIKGIIDLLQANEYYGQSETIDIAKGRYALPTTWKDTFKWIKRIWLRRKLK